MLVCLRVRPDREGQSTRQRAGRRVRVQERFSWVGFACELVGKMEIREKGSGSSGGERGFYSLQSFNVCGLVGCFSCDGLPRR